MKKTLIILALVITFCLIAGCASNKNTNTQTANAEASPSQEKTDQQSPEEKVADDEMTLQIGYDPKEAAKARSAAREYAGAQFQGWDVKGISCQEQANGTYFVDVDLYRGKENQILRSYVEPMFSSSGEHYWKASPLTSLIQERIQKQIITKLAQDLDTKQDQ